MSVFHRHVSQIFDCWMEMKSEKLNSLKFVGKTIKTNQEKNQDQVALSLLH